MLAIPRARDTGSLLTNIFECSMTTRLLTDSGMVRDLQNLSQHSVPMGPMVYGSESTIPTYELQSRNLRARQLPFQHTTQHP